MAKRYDYTCNFNLQDCINTLGLDERGEVQQYVTNEVLRLSGDYVPFDLAGVYQHRSIPGSLQKSGHIEDGTDIVWDSNDSARRLYYHPEYNFQGAPVRGGYWVDRMMQNGGQRKIEEGAREIVKKF